MALARRSRTLSNLSPSVHQRLNGYALMASAAGVGVMALAPAAEAKIVYTPANISIDSVKTGIDINNDGIRDFFVQVTRGGHAASFGVFPANVEPGNAIWGTNMSASALPAGYTVGTNAKLQKSHNRMVSCGGSGPSCNGLWANLKNPRYLGFAITIRGKIHYGWARITVHSPGLSAVITGYAYETTPNTPIVTGKREGTEDPGVAVAPSAPDKLATAGPTLGLLARGSDGLSAWRKQRD